MQSMIMSARLPARFQDQVGIQSGYQDDTKDLWSEIWNTLMGYINADDSPSKLQQKDSLVELMSRFVSRVAHDSKFYLSSTPAVLRASFQQASLQPLSAAQAFEALHEYAVRILAQPWRTEFTKINMYSGYYVHTVQSRLLEAHRLLEEMGFRVDAASQTATLREPVDVDQVTKAAIDTLMASVECRIIEGVLEHLPAGAYTPLGVLCYRSSYVGGVETAVHHLNVTLRQRNFQRYFAPPAETGGGGGGGGQGVAYPWQRAPSPAAPAPLPPVPTARLVDVGDRDPQDGWIPKTIGHQRPDRAERPAPAAPALLPATLDDHQPGSWSLVDGPAVTQAGQSRQPPATDSLDDSWGYVLNSLDRRRPVSGRYDNVPETAAGAPRGGSSQRSATLPAPRAEPRAPPRGGRAYSGGQQQPNGAPRLPVAGAVPEPAGTDYSPPAELSATQPLPTYEYSDGVRAGTVAEHNAAPRGSLCNDYSTGARVVEHNSAPRASLPTEYLQTNQQTTHQTHQHASQQARQGHQASKQTSHGQQAFQQTPPQGQQQTHHQGHLALQTTNHQGHQATQQSHLQGHQTSQQAHHQGHQPSQQTHQVHQASKQANQSHQPPQQGHPQGHLQASHSLPSDPHPASRASPANDTLVPRSSSMVNDHSKAGRPSAGDPSLGARWTPPAESRAGGSGSESSGSRRPSSQRPAPRPEPSPEPVDRRRPELGAWPTRPEPAPAEEQWSCHACTYLNGVSVRVCAMCGKSRQPLGRAAPVVPAAVPPAEPPDDLACPQCTLLNSRRARRCGACEAELQPVQ